MKLLTDAEMDQLNDLAKRSNGSGPSLICNVVDWDEVVLRPIEWVVQDRIPFGEFTMVDGQGGIGKTTTMLDIASRASRGAAMPDGSPCSPLDVLVIAEEDSKDIIKARLIAAKANLDRVHLVQSVGDNEHFFTLPTDSASLLATVEKFNARIVLIDALFSHFDDAINSHKAQDVRRALVPLSTIAHEAPSKPAILAIRHWGKGARSAADRGMGSSDIRNVCRSVLSVGPHPQDEQRFVIAVSKSNLGRPCPALTYTLENTCIKGDNTSVDVAAVSWGELADISADELANDTLPSSDEMTRTEAAGDFLHNALAEGPRSSESIYADGKAAGFSPATLKRAAKRQQIIQTRGGFPARGTWALPQSSGSQSAQSAHVLDSELSGLTDEPTGLFEARHSDTSLGPQSTSRALGPPGHAGESQDMELKWIQ